MARRKTELIGNAPAYVYDPVTGEMRRADGKPIAGVRKSTPPQAWSAAQEGEYSTEPTGVMKWLGYIAFALILFIMAISV